jgi:radical SAM/Cys-rich protein
MDPREQLALLNNRQPSFVDVVTGAHGDEAYLKPESMRIFQMNIGRRCNLACRHCHLDASPHRTEQMDRATVDTCLAVIARVPEVAVVDITGGSPEMNPNFRYLVTEARSLGKHVMDRCNLTILDEPGQENLLDFLVDQQVEVVASLPHYASLTTDKQRGAGVFKRSITALRALNEAGYGSRLPLNLVYNPGGIYLSSSQSQLESEFRRNLSREYGIVFNQLFCINNMPLSRFLVALLRKGMYERYMETLVNAFNPVTVAGLMCRYQISVGWDGAVYDCDFNQALGLTVETVRHITSFDYKTFMSRSIRTAAHCFGCTAGGGSSCGGEIV